MVRPKTLVNEANKNADIISDDLIKKYPGKKIRKKFLILKYELPYNQAYFIFEILRKKGFNMNSKFIFIPLPHPVKNTDLEHFPSSVPS